jgi:DNA-binding beta-propeller fold protein YncE
MKTLLIGLGALSLFGAAQYHLLSKIPVPGNGGWDYLSVDQAGRRLYVSHGTEVDVLDVDSGAIVGKVPNTKGVHGIALAPEFNRGFASDGQTNDVTIFDLKTLAVVGHAPTGKKPDAIIYDPATKRVIANNGDSDSSTIINAADGTVAGAVDLGGGPEFAAADGKGKVYINLEDKSEMVKIDPVALKLEARWPLKPCEAPSSLAMDTATRRLFAGCRNHLMTVVDADTGKVVTTMPIGDHVDATEFDAATKLIYFSNGDGTVDIFHEDSPDHFTAVEKVKTEAGAKTMALDPKTRKIFLSVAERDGRTVRPGTFHVLVCGR